MNGNSWLAVSRGLSSTVSAGPRVSRATGRAAVARLYAGSTWALANLPIQGRDNGPGRNALRRARVISNRDAVRILCRDSAVNNRSLDVASIVSIRQRALESPSLVVGGSVYLNAAAFLTAVSRYRLDAVDYARWISLEAGTRVELRHVLAPAGRCGRFVADLLVQESMNRVSPRDIASAVWIRNRVQERPGTDITAADAEIAMHFLAELLAAERDISDIVMIPPSEREIREPSLWIDRIG